MGKAMEYDDELFAPTAATLDSATRDLDTAQEFEARLALLCGQVIPDNRGVTFPAFGGRQLLALALVAVADLSPRQGRSVSCEHVSHEDPAGDSADDPDGVWWFHVTRRLGAQGLISVRIHVPDSRRWLAAFDGNRLASLDVEDN